MRQLLATTILLALMAVPALYFLRDTPEVRAVTHAVGVGVDGAAETGSADAIIEGMQRVAAGFATSLSGAGQSTDEFSVATIRDSGGAAAPVAIRKARGRTDGTAPAIKVAAIEDRDPPIRTAIIPAQDEDATMALPEDAGVTGYLYRGAGAGPVVRWRTPVDLAALSGGNGLPRHYPTSFTWFDLV